MVSHDSERVAAAVKAAGLELRDLDDGTVLAWRELDEGTAFYKLTPISMTGGFTGTVELCKGSPKIHGVEGLNKGKEDTRSCASGRRRTAKRWWCTRKDLYSCVRAKKRGCGMHSCCDMHMHSCCCAEEVKEEVEVVSSSSELRGGSEGGI